MFFILWGCFLVVHATWVRCALFILHARMLTSHRFGSHILCAGRHWFHIAAGTDWGRESAVAAVDWGRESAVAAVWHGFWAKW